MELDFGPINHCAKRSDRLSAEFEKILSFDGKNLIQKFSVLLNSEVIKHLLME